MLRLHKSQHREPLRQRVGFHCLDSHLASPRPPLMRLLGLVSVIGFGCHEFIAKGDAPSKRTDQSERRESLCAGAEVNNPSKSFIGEGRHPETRLPNRIVPPARERPRHDAQVISAVVVGFCALQFPRRACWSGQGLNLHLHYSPDLPKLLLCSIAPPPPKKTGHEGSCCQVAPEPGRKNRGRILRSLTLLL